MSSLLRSGLVAQLTRFGVVGTVGLVIDVALFNLLRLTVLAPDVLHEGPVIAKLVSTSVAIVANWLGNRYWTFHREKRAHPVGEGLRFAAVSIAAMGIPLGCLWVSHYVLGFTSLLADNVSSNVVGLALGMVFRFWLYRTWVFAEDRGLSSERSERIETGGRSASFRYGAGAPTQPAGASGTTERTIVPSGTTPLHRIQAVAPVDDRGRSHD
ncbi:GtrA family protein [Salinibacterium sp. SYSU T00001]|uniref:GtrA family protein n=1 Tax=Homoserinimonas sedimenticola TaxID=2986805 RepID=UPI002236BBA7|nr:GtrA family protein [Salinibacterium sedimenticola]MCW4385087.1 GtrA family protein [Salinibacterium sedimenticola]